MTNMAAEILKKISQLNFKSQTSTLYALKRICETNENLKEINRNPVEEFKQFPSITYVFKDDTSITVVQKPPIKEI